MDAKTSKQDTGATGGAGDGGAGEPAPLTPLDQNLRARTIAHCQALAKLDRDYAVWAFNQYDEQMPWLRLRMKS